MCAMMQKLRISVGRSRRGRGSWKREETLWAILPRTGGPDEPADCRPAPRPGNVACWLACQKALSLSTRNAAGSVRHEAPRFAGTPTPGRVTHQPHLTRKSIHWRTSKSQIKRIKTNLKAQERNKAIKSELKTAIRRTHAAISRRATRVPPRRLSSSRRRSSTRPPARASSTRTRPRTASRPSPSRSPRSSTSATRVPRRTQRTHAPPPPRVRRSAGVVSFLRMLGFRGGGWACGPWAVGERRTAHEGLRCGRRSGSRPAPM